MSARIAAFLVWALVAAVAVFWGLRLLVEPVPVPSQTQAVSSSAALRGDVLRLFADPVTANPKAVPLEPALASRFKLVGLMAPKTAEAGSHAGVALLVVDGKPPRAYRVGARIDQTLVLQSVVGRKAAIGPAQGAAAVQLELPPLPPPATGSLPLAASLVPPAFAPPPIAPPSANLPPSSPNLPPPATDSPLPTGPARDADNRR